MIFKKLRSLPTSFLLGSLILITILLLVGFSDIIAPFNPLEQNPNIRLQPPSSRYLFGTDHFGRDIFSRVLFGGKYTLTSSLIALVFSFFFGVVIGIYSGIRGGIIDTIIVRIIDTIMAFPFIVFAMIVVTFIGTGLLNLLFVIILVKWIPFAKLSRSITLKSKNDADILAAFVLGAKLRVIIFKELFPKVMGQTVVLSTFELGNLILSISALSFLGLGAKPPSPEWGSMLADSKAYFFQAPHLFFSPVIFIFFVVLALNLMGEGLRDYFDPYNDAPIF